MFKLLLRSIFTLITLFSYSQLDHSAEKIPYESKKYFDLKGNVKSTEITVTKNHFNSDEKITNTTVLHFNNDGYLLRKYDTYGDSIIILTEENIFNTNNQLIHKTEYSRKRSEINNRTVTPMEFTDYQTKYLYNSEGKLLTRLEKSHQGEDFFLTKKYWYEDNLLKEELAINHHFGPNRIEWTSGNYLMKYAYNSEGLVVKQQEYKYEGKGYNMSVKDGIEEFELIIQDEKTLDTTKLVLEREWKKEYNDTKQLILEEMSDYSMNEDTSHLISTYEYFGSKLSKVSRQLKDNYIIVNSNDYQIVKNDTLITKEFLTYKDESLEKSNIRYYTYQFKADGSYSKFNLDIDKILGSTENYNKYGHLIEIRNAQNEFIKKYNYQYDTHGNWIYKQWVSFPDEIEIELIERKIDYYD